MRICLVTPYPPKEVSGVGQVVANLAKGLEERGHDPLVLTKSSREEGPATPGLIEIDYKQIKFLGGALFALKCIFRILRERKDLDGIHLHSVSWLTVGCAFIGCVLGIPRVLTIHGKFPTLSGRVSNALFGLAEALVIRFSNMVTCVSQETKDSQGLDAAVVVTNGVDTERFKPGLEVRERTRENLGIGQSFALLFLGRWVAHKGIYELIDVSRELATRGLDLKLILVGSGETQKVEKAIREKGLERYVIPVGRVKDVVPMYLCSDLYVLSTSPLEGLPLTILEAMACGLPCMASSISGIPEVITDGINGFLIDEGNLEALQNRILWCTENHSKMEDVSRKARETILARFNIQKMTDDYLRVYRESLNP